MPSSPISLIIAFIALLLLTNSSVAFPITNQQEPLLQDESSALCDSVDIYTTEWFLLNTRPQFRREIHSKALFYTRGTTDQARRLACRTKEYVTLWDIWPEWLYDSKDVSSNKLRCIHRRHDLKTIFYENMSRAYARMARRHATIMHSFSDYADPPLGGIWGRVELPALEGSTDIYELDKINEDRSLYDVFLVQHKATRTVFEQAIQDVRSLFRQAKARLHGITDETFGSCAMWDSESDNFLDGLF